MVTEAWTTYADRVVLRHTDANDDWLDVTGREAQARVDAVAKGLKAHGIKPGQSVGIMSRTRYEWTVLDFAIWAVGAVPVPLYDTSSKAQIEWITSDADVSIVFVETAEHAALAGKVAKDKGYPLKDVLVIDEGALGLMAAKDQFVLESIDRAITRANKSVSRAESVRKFEVLDTDFTVANSYLTPSMKLKRAGVMADYTGE